MCICMCFVGEHCVFELAMPSSLGPSSVAAALQEALENSARLIDRHLQEDRCFPDLSELLNVPSHSKSPPLRHSCRALFSWYDVTKVMSWWVDRTLLGCLTLQIMFMRFLNNFFLQICPLCLVCLTWITLYKAPVLSACQIYQSWAPSAGSLCLQSWWSSLAVSSHI